MAQEVILAEQTLEFTNGFYAANAPDGFELIVGNTYQVVWDGTEYTSVAEYEDGVEGGPIVIYNDAGGYWMLYASAELNGGVAAINISSADTTAATHTVAIYTAAAEEGTEEDTGGETEEPAAEGASIVLKDRNGEDVTYTGIKTVTFDTPTEGEQVTFTLGVEQTGKEVELALADGDQQIKADDGYLLKELTIKKPDTLLPENIRNGTTVAGVTGEFIGDTEEATVALSMADGDQVVEPSADGKLLSKVTITKPETLVPENIAAGVDIAGIIGTFAGGSSADCCIEYTLNEDGEPVSAKMIGFTTVPRYCFVSMQKLESVDFSESPNLTAIGDYAFRDCTALTSIDIPDGVTSIGNYAFYACSALTSINIPDSVISIGSYAFLSCSALTSINIPEGVTSIGASTFTSCTVLANVVLPSTLTSIGTSAFASCKAITNITIPDSVTSIGNMAFQSCYAMTSATIGSGVTSISKQAFYGAGLTSVTFKDTTTWYVTQTQGATSGTTLSPSDLSSPSTAATYLKTTYYSYYWYKT